jgi:hypothetical protein
MDVNWESEEVDRWFANDEPLYHFMNEVLDSNDDEGAAKQLQEFARDICQDFGDFCGLSAEQLDRVDWDYVVKENR